MLTARPLAIGFVAFLVALPSDVRKVRLWSVTARPLAIGFVAFLVALPSDVRKVRLWSVTARPLAIGFVAFLVASLRRTKSTPPVTPRRRLASHPRGWQLQGGESLQNLFESLMPLSEEIFLVFGKVSMSSLSWLDAHLTRISHKLPTAVYSFAPIEPPTP